jgi:pyruvate/2-oxoglutarate dehydrogenase complex dihydrolipoamide dehydrogenase (E3) component
MVPDNGRGECAGKPNPLRKMINHTCNLAEESAAAIRHPIRMFTDPTRRVGLSEGEAERQGVLVRVARLPMDSVLGAQATDQRQGFMKALAATATIAFLASRCSEPRPAKLWQQFKLQCWQAFPIQDLLMRILRIRRWLKG